MSTSFRGCGACCRLPLCVEMGIRLAPLYIYIYRERERDVPICWTYVYILFPYVCTERVPHSAGAGRETGSHFAWKWAFASPRHIYRERDVPICWTYIYILFPYVRTERVPDSAGTGRVTGSHFA